jgi:basic membrane lipoprotein Med (substrate-binding protein (PBP1-ABC) superfamily)
MFLKRLSLIAIVVAVVVLTANCAPAAAPEPATEAEEAPLIYAFFATPVEEPWVHVIKVAMDEMEAAGEIRWKYVDDLGYAGDLERVMREVIEKEKPAAIFGESFGNEEAVRRVAADHPDMPFVIGSGLGPADPNYAVFDNWIHESGYLAGIIAGGMTESNVIGVVAGYPVPEVNRIVNAFIDGVRESNPDAEVLVTFINSWFDPPAAKEAALAQLDAGADVMYAERFGVIEAAVERDAWAFGMMSDQHELGPDHVLTSVTWNMTPTVEYAVAQIKAGTFVAQDLKDFTMMAKGGSALAPYHGMEKHIPEDILKLVEQRKDEITKGLFRVNIDEAQPAGSQ